MSRLWPGFGKRLFDLVVAIGLLLVLGPVLLVVALLVRLKLGSPVLYAQRRLGWKATEFTLYKFRSMTSEVDASGHQLPDEVRLTRFGQLLRSTSLDELPQIINILKGEMSFIGPRATLVSYRELLLQRYPRRFEVLPGITSLPGVRGRNALSWDEKFTMDIEYVENFGFRMDMHILLRTIPVVFGRGGISMPGVSTASRYDQETHKGGDA